MNSQALELAPGTHLCAMYRGVAQRDEVLGPYVSEGLQAGHTCFVAVSDQDPDRVQAFESADGPGWKTTVSTALSTTAPRSYASTRRTPGGSRSYRRSRI